MFKTVSIGSMTADRSTVRLPSQATVAIVGAGFGGLGCAIELKRQGLDDLLVLERARDVGGTWFANSYPGCQCDVPSNLYSFSFAPKHDWTRTYPLQPQILDYLRGCTRRFDVVRHLRTECELLQASWEDDSKRWRIETSQGEMRARFLVVAPGLLSEPKLPELPGLQRFVGHSFHTADWNHDHDLKGSRVALLGTGASAIQIGPQIQPLVERLSVFQRTPPWILPHPDRAVGPKIRGLFRALPAAQRVPRAAVYAIRESMVPGLARRPSLLKLQELTARALLRLQISEPELRAKLEPDYSIGCKRVLLSNDWYPMLRQPNVELVTDPIVEVRERSIVTADAGEHPVDTIVFATGFTPSDPPIAKRLRGRNQMLLSQSWNGSPQAYLGTSVAGFPNLFLVYGPNLNLGHSSIVYMLESQIRYVVDALRTVRNRRLATVEVDPRAQRRWNAEIQKRLAKSVWDTGGCASWYLDRNGRNSIMWPGFTFEFRRRARRFDLDNYRAMPEPARWQTI